MVGKNNYLLLSCVKRSSTKILKQLHYFSTVYFDTMSSPTHPIQWVMGVKQLGQR